MNRAKPANLRAATLAFSPAEDPDSVRVLVNALPTTNLSGRHVLLGHLRQLASWAGEHHFTVLYHRANADIRRDLGGRVDWIECPEYTAAWLTRSLWEHISLSHMIRRARADLLLNLSGTTLDRLDVPQAAYAMNPWALVPGLWKTPFERVKAALQRRAYRAAVRKAAVMLYLSEFMREAYRQNAGALERASQVVHPGLDDETHEAAARAGATSRSPHQIVSVSVMARHKDVETLLRALAVVRRTTGVPARLLLVGPWSDAGYERRTRRLVAGLSLDDAVTVTGAVDRQELFRLYAESKVFALMSRCESFGIPAVEAQAFGTPVVSSNCCAIPEACGKGGVFPEPGDVEGTAEALARMLTDEPFWCEASDAARRNAGRYHWSLCSRRLLQALLDVPLQSSPSREPAEGTVAS